MITGKNFIGNNRSAENTKTYKTYNPLLNLENPTEFSEASKKEIDQALELATEAFASFKKFSGLKKSAFLNAIAEEIIALDQVLIDTYCSETGLPEGRAIGERGRTVGQLRQFADLVEEGSWVGAVLDTADPNREPLPKPDIRKMLIPIGPVVVFGASNFPLAFSTAGGDTASALASGCPVIVKSHPMHAGTGELVASAIIAAAKKTGMPNGIFSNLNSSGAEVGTYLAKHPLVKAIGFTGSHQAGRSLYNLAKERKEPIPVFAEMGSVNPVILFPEAIKTRPSEIAQTYAQSITLGTGQFCTNPGLIFGIKGIALDFFIETLSQEILNVKPSCMLHPSIVGNYEKNRRNAIEQEGLLVAASYETALAENHARQTLAVVDGAAFKNNPFLHHEIFGPFSMIVQCTDFDEMKSILSQMEGQLTGTVVAEMEELKKHTSVINILQDRVGRILFNGAPTGVEVCPAMVHGGPYPASTDSRFTAVGTASIHRWVRPFSFQNWPNELLPDELKNENPLDISRIVDDTQTYEAI